MLFPSYYIQTGTNICRLPFSYIIPFIFTYATYLKLSYFFSNFCFDHEKRKGGSLSKKFVSVVYKFTSSSLFKHQNSQVVYERERNLSIYIPHDFS